MLKLEFYGVLSEVVGASELEWPLAEPVSVTQVLGALSAEFAGLERHLPRTACAVNDEIVPRERLVQRGDTLALLPPVSGG